MTSYQHIKGRMMNNLKLTKDGHYVVFRSGGIARIQKIIKLQHTKSYKITFNNELSDHGSFHPDGRRGTKDCNSYEDIIFSSRLFIVAFFMGVYRMFIYSKTLQLPSIRFIKETDNSDYIVVRGLGGEMGLLYFIAQKHSWCGLNIYFVCSDGTQSIFDQPTELKEKIGIINA